jgi:hypothetical protein
MLSKRLIVVFLLVAAPLLVAALAIPGTSISAPALPSADDVQRPQGVTVHEWEPLHRSRVPMARPSTGSRRRSNGPSMLRGSDRFLKQ